MKLYTKKDIAELLQISVSNVDRLLKQNNVPVMKLGPHKRSPVRISEEDLLNWLNSTKLIKNTEPLSC